MGIFRDALVDKDIECKKLEEENEQLKIQNSNNKYVIDNLRKRLKKLTGCCDFGNLDGMNGACVECSYNEKELFERCWNFKFDK